MDFKTYINEVIEPVKPTEVKRSNIVKNKGTMRQMPVIEYRWTTQKGNQVALHFERRNNDVKKEFNVVFYVNDTMKEEVIDNEILPNVVWILREKADALKAEALRIEAVTSEKDTVFVKNLNLQPHKDNILQILRSKLNRIRSTEPETEDTPEHIINLYKKINKPYETKRKNPKIEYIEKEIKEIENNKELSYPSTNMDIFDSIVERKELEELITKYNTAVRSQEHGTYITKNRRKEIYKRLLEKYMSDRWDIEQMGTFFYLYRKNDLKS